MSPEKLKTPEELSDSDDSDMTLDETELTLGLPGAEARGKSGTKQIFPETNRRGSGSEGKAAESVVSGRRNSGIPRALVAAKAQLVAGWPPVRSVWKNAMAKKYVKVAADGAPYLRKVDLEIYDSYDEFLAALQSMFPSFSIRNDNYLGGGRLMNEADGVEYVATYQDKDGDWMLVGDVPWNMFVESCKRLRVMKSSDAMTPRAPDVTSTVSSS